MPRLTSGLYLLLVACGGGGGFPDAAVIEDTTGPTGRFAMTWSVVDQNSQPIDCDRIAGQVMTVLAHNLEFEGGVPEAFGCSTGSGMSGPLVPGTYEMDFELSGTFGTLAQGMKQTPVLIEANNTTQLAPVTFQVQALGNLSLQIATNDPNGNCAGGAGIDQVSFTLTHNSDGTCEPITLNIAAGSQPGGTYTINCAAPVDRNGCIGADQVITATNVASDSYTIRIRGKKAGEVCWTNMDSIQVPPLGKTLTRTLNLAQPTPTPAGC